MPHQVGVACDTRSSRTGASLDGTKIEGSHILTPKQTIHVILYQCDPPLSKFCSIVL